MPTKILKVVSLLVRRNHCLLDDAETTTLPWSTSHVYCILIDFQDGAQLWIRILLLRYVYVGATYELGAQASLMVSCV